MDGVVLDSPERGGSRGLQRSRLERSGGEFGVGVAEGPHANAATDMRTSDATHTNQGVGFMETKHRSPSFVRVTR
jgi:hypothetical protein